jgi:hypothetical protein
VSANIVENESGRDSSEEDEARQEDPTDADLEEYKGGNTCSMLVVSRVPL